MMSLQNALLIFQESLALDLNKHIQESLVDDAVIVMHDYFWQLQMVVPDDHPIKEEDVTYLSEIELYELLQRYNPL